jgi:hypothetical protein
MDRAALDSIRRIPALYSLLILARRSERIMLQVYRDGAFDEAAFMISGQLAILERYGLVELIYQPPTAPTTWSNLQLQYRLTAAGQAFVDSGETVRATALSGHASAPQNASGPPIQ